MTFNEMSECLECGEPADGKIKHPVWLADDLCNDCHKSVWDMWMADQLDEYKAATGKAYSEVIE